MAAVRENYPDVFAMTLLGISITKPVKNKPAIRYEANRSFGSCDRCHGKP